MEFLLYIALSWLVLFPLHFGYWWRGKFETIKRGWKLRGVDDDKIRD